MNSQMERRDRQTAFTPELLPPLEDVEATGPLTPKERKYLSRIHDARDHYGTARWMRGMALEAAFRRLLFRGEDGTRTRQEYLNDEWDGMSESAAYLEIREWRLARAIETAYGRAVASSHVRALAAAAELHPPELVAAAYAHTREYGRLTGRRVTAEVTGRLGEYLITAPALAAAAPLEIPESGEQPERPELESLFTPAPQPDPGPEREPEPVPKPRNGKTPDSDGTTGEPLEPTAVIPKIWNGWRLSQEHTDRLSDWIAGEAGRLGMDPDEAAGLLLDAVTSTSTPLRPWPEHSRP
ncbi:hypothetical protein [Streptomyces sp. NPDC088557]|uniref:hypothetical protein n=1 Tax=Streptomyces sp. NPDC088557 TaxID=3365867 RepID=UPI003826B755